MNEPQNNHNRSHDCDSDYNGCDFVSDTDLDSDKGRGYNVQIEKEQLSLVKPLKYGELKEQIKKLQERFERRKLER